MTVIRLTDVPWKIGSDVDAYPRKSDQMLPDMPPTGVAKVDTDTVAPDQSLVYDLSDGAYWAVAPITPGQRDYRYVGFVVATPDTNIKGDTGQTGPSGTPGPAGPQGLPGPQGPSGGIGPIGNTGAQGPRGPNGAQGVPGRDGDQGAVGPQGPQGAKGDTGDPGGPVGPQGPAGPQGVKGLTGDPGPQGPKGDKGDVGNTGPVGAQGIPGPDGPQGVQGIPGPEGINWRGAWSAATNYAIDDAVFVNGSAFIALIANTNVQPTATGGTWSLLALGVRWRSAWGAGNTYAAQDAVSYNGASYISLQNGNVNHLPDALAPWWALMAAKGDVGAVGPAGPVPDIHCLLTAPGAFGNLNASWGLIPIGAVEITQSVPGTPDFVQNGDSTITIKTAGLYMFVAGAYVNGSAVAAETLLFALNLPVKAGNVAPTEADAAIGSERHSEGPGNWSFPNRTAVGVRRCLVNDRVAIYCYAAASPATAKPVICNQFQIARLAA